MNTLGASGFRAQTYTEIARLAARGPLSTETRRGLYTCVGFLALFLVAYLSSSAFERDAATGHGLAVSVGVITMLALILGTYDYVRFLSDAMIETRIFNLELQPRYDELSETLYASWGDRIESLERKQSSIEREATAAAAIRSLQEQSLSQPSAADMESRLRQALEDWAFQDVERLFSTLRLARRLGRMRTWLDVVLPSLMMMVALACMILDPLRPVALILR